MDDLQAARKPVGHLAPADFRQFPVWTWYENDEDESLVVPVTVTRRLPADMAGVLFIAATFRLADGSNLAGNISLNLASRQVYALELYAGERRFIAGGHPEQVRDTLSRLAAWLAQPAAAVSPLTYETAFFFADGRPIAGELDLADW